MQNQYIGPLYSLNYLWRRELDYQGILMGDIFESVRP